MSQRTQVYCTNFQAFQCVKYPIKWNQNVKEKSMKLPNNIFPHSFGKKHVCPVTVQSKSSLQSDCSLSSQSESSLQSGRLCQHPIRAFVTIYLWFWWRSVKASAISFHQNLIYEGVYKKQNISKFQRPLKEITKGNWKNNQSIYCI